MLARVGGPLGPVCRPVCLPALTVYPGPAALMHDGDDASDVLEKGEEPALQTRQGTCSKGGTSSHGGMRLKGHTCVPNKPRRPGSRAPSQFSARGESRASIFSRSGRPPSYPFKTPQPDPASFPDGSGRPPRLDKIACFPRHERQIDTIASHQSRSSRKKEPTGRGPGPQPIHVLDHVWDLDSPTDPSMPRPNCALSCLFVFLTSAVGGRPGRATPRQWEERQIRTGKRTARWKVRYRVLRLAPDVRVSQGQQRAIDSATRTPAVGSLTRRLHKRINGREGNPESASEKEQESVKRHRERPTQPLRLICIPSPMSQSHPWTRHPGPPQGYLSQALKVAR
ncbi:predicted protein [Verticillium alfalfae VaMs.102]|uniref:Predicted protein n=1 Tax=Verticillium alfalfae (strain VaMs.102 / ATCC MYA-4576 / FGSC 10136) TaxID=526221 RepID=C9S5N9_VERA1|nr:predicted protein [Verticillium alfalfae VaMs.102]EEY14265.1 predicted protein [Verticillium alfalfae VaMs.102]